ncbi:MAG TPA: alpha-galactosidase [Pseudonocardiaceae bacterium]|nr:alpha-galactosidase [Pseudonocardiaceae bacterium]
MPAISFDADTRTWLLATPNTSYALRLADGNVLRHLHWGAPLSLAQAVSLDDVPPFFPRGHENVGEGTEELAIDGGLRFGVPSLQVRFADGVRAIEWEYADHQIVVRPDGETLTIRLADRHYPLRISLHYRLFTDSDVIDRWTTVANESGTGEDITLLRTDSATWSIPLREDYRLRHAIGQWARETQLVDGPVAIGETVFTSRRGLTSMAANPWVMVDAGDAGEEQGEVWSTVLAWSGTWRITVQRTAVGVCSVTTGFGHDNITWNLAAGESLSTPVSSGLYAPDGFGGASRRWHDYARAHVLPHPDEDRPVIYNSWEATGFDVNETNQKSLAARAAALGIELFVMDDGWFGARSDDHAGLGDWTVNRDRFPGDLEPLIDEVHRLGMRFGLWVEPEMVNPDSDLYRAHPDWVLHFPNRQRSEMRNQLVLNFARDDVADWAHEWLNQLVSKHEIDFLKWDMNRSFSEAGWPEHAQDQDLLYRRYVENLYSILDRLRADHPNLRIESCSSGGGRVDFGILSRTDQAWTSDNTDALDRLAIQHGFSQVYPPNVMAAWVTDSPNFLTGRSVPLRYRFHVAMAGVMAVGGNLTEWTDEELAEAAELVSTYKKVRATVQHGTQYRLRAPHDDGITATQYVRDGEVAVFAYLQSPHFGEHNRPLRLRGLKPDAQYRDEDTGAVHHGAVLLHRGLPLDLPTGDYASSLTRLTEIR